MTPPATVLDAVFPHVLLMAVALVLGGDHFFTTTVYVLWRLPRRQI